MDAIIDVRNLTKLYNNKRGVSDLSLQVNKGEIFGFLGPNGSGKTTSMKVMTGLLKADSGSVRLFGYDVSTEFEKAMAKVGAIIESPEHYLFLTAGENLKQSARYYDVDSKRIDEVLELCGLRNYKNEKVKNFSLGMKQRLGIANAILHKPELLILDEPLNGLDVEGMIYIRNMIKYLSDQEKVTVFISSHLIHDVELTCKKIGIILQGKLRSVDTIDNILRNFSSLENYFVNEVDKNAVV